MAARTLEEMAEKGKSKLARKADAISRSWEAAKERCISNYAKLPFGPTRKANHAAGVRAARHRIDYEKWYVNWTAKMKE